MIIFFFLFCFSFLFFVEKLFFVWVIPIFLICICYFFLSDISSLMTRIGILGLDYFRCFIVFITLWVFYYCVLCFEDFKSFFYMWLIFLFLILCFCIDNYLLFYVFFEFVFLLIFVFLLRWGKTIERTQASFYIFFYTLIFSLPFFLFLIFCINISSRVVFFSFIFYKEKFEWLVLFVIMVFIVKLPLYGVHLWLPKAHVEAPVTGSILLAGVLLKLGAYGLFRFFPFLSTFSNIFIFWNVFFYVSLLGGVLISLICLHQRDLKIIIAYSSVVHISFIIVGFISFTDIGLFGALLILVAHGFISSFLFLGLNCIYELFHSRRIFVIKGLIVLMPLFCLVWFIGIVLNISFPPFMSFFSEIIIVRGLSFLRGLDWLVLLRFFFLCGVYNIYLYVFPTHGGYSFVNSFTFNFKFLFLRVIHFFFVLIFPLLCLWLTSLVKNISLWS